MEVLPENQSLPGEPDSRIEMLHDWLTTRYTESQMVMDEVTVLEHPYRAPSYMCFGLASIPGELADAKANMLAAMAATGADTLVTIFHSCHRELVGLERTHGIRGVNWVHLLAEGMGLAYQDEYKAWRSSDDPEAAIGAERIAAAGEEAVRKLVLPELTRPR
jgi:hypothetical protein